MWQISLCASLSLFLFVCVYVQNVLIGNPVRWIEPLLLPATLKERKKEQLWSTGGRDGAIWEKKKKKGLMASSSSSSSSSFLHGAMASSPL